MVTYSEIQIRAVNYSQNYLSCSPNDLLSLHREKVIGLIPTKGPFCVELTSSPCA